MTRGPEPGMDNASRTGSTNLDSVGKAKKQGNRSVLFKATFQFNADEKLWLQSWTSASVYFGAKASPFSNSPRSSRQGVTGSKRAVCSLLITK